MDTYNIPIICYVLMLPLISSAASVNCPISYCGQSFINIRFPFRLLGQQPERCGFPGFDISCLFPSMNLIRLSKSGDFGVRSIDYRSQAIQLFDPLNCLPARLLTFDLSNSPFSSFYFKNYSIVTCPNNASLGGFMPIGCLSNSSYSRIAIDSESVVASMTSNNQTGCLVTGHVRLPLVAQPDKDMVSSQLDEDITLTWGTPDCESCEAIGVSCGYANSSTEMTKCLFDNREPKGAGVFRIIAFAMAIPAMTASLAIACFLCAKDSRGDRMISNRRASNIFNTTTVAPEEETAHPSVVGLDQERIESYTKVVLGESKRLPGHDDALCPICLSEYKVKETVRCIPECRHCFHAECIDEWLKMNGTCPICRNSLSPVGVDSQHV